MIKNTKVSLSNVRDDQKVVKKLGDLLNDCINKNIIVVYQNGDRFDIPKIRGRLLFHRLPDVDPKYLATIDTLKASNGLGLDYRRLDYKDKLLGGRGKVETRGWLMWRDIVSRHTTRERQKQALKEMVTYCDGDILALERDFRRLEHTIRLPNYLLYHGLVDGCPQCSGKDYKKRGMRYTKTRAYQAYECQSCGKRFQDTKSVQGSYFVA